MSDTEHHEAQMGYVLDHIDRRFDEQRVQIEALVADCLRKHVSHMAQDSDMAKPYWQAGADHVTDHWWGKLSKRGMTLLLAAICTALLIWLGSLGIIFRKP